MTLRWLDSHRAAHLFAVANIAFLGVDISLAHLENDFAHRAEFVPLFFSALATLMLLPGAAGSTRPVVVTIDRIVGWSAIVVGVTGMVMHLRSGFFEQQTLHNLVYSAPFIAPLAYVGVGCLILLLRSPEIEGPALGSWILLLSLGGFVGNFVLSVLDHAQNGFFSVAEWIPVASAALAVGFLAVEIVRPGAIAARLTVLVLVIQVIVALVGSVIHLTTDLSHVTPRLIDRFAYGAPVFAPMLFADLAVLAAIGLWARDG